MEYIGTKRVIKSEVLYCLLQKTRMQRHRRDKQSKKKMRCLGEINRAKISKS